MRCIFIYIRPNKDIFENFVIKINSTFFTDILLKLKQFTSNIEILKKVVETHRLKPVELEV